jgi:TPR repeat protein
MGDDLREDLSALTSQQITQRYKKVNEAIEDIRDVTILSLDVIRWGNEQAIRVLHAMAHQLRLPVPTDKPMHDCKEHITFLRGVDIAQTKKFGRFFELVQEYTSNGKALKEKELIAQRLKPECHIDNPIALLALGRIYMRGRSVEKDEQKAETFFIAATCQVFKIWEEVEKMPIPPQRVSDLRDVVFHRVHCEYMKREEMEKRILTNLFL